MLVKLKSGSFTPGDGVHSGATHLDKRALLVYAGEFESAEGPVSVTADKIARLVANHNSMLSRVKRLASGDVPLKNCPPIQLDHSTSARDTVGRLVGPVEEAFYESDNGSQIPAIYGTVRILGRDNVERVEDGRWTNLSIGADFEVGHLMELTITPFPAAANASLLSAGTTKEDEEKDTMLLAKLKAFLTGRKGMSDDDATAKLAAMDDTAKAELTKEMEDDTARLAAESAEKEAAEKKAKEEAEAKLTAARGQIAKLSAGFTQLVSESRLQAKQGRILTRLSKLRAEAKITPAEVKKIDLVALSKSDDAAVELALKTYEDREPVILVGQVGSTRAPSVARMARSSQMTKLEQETRANMSLLKKTAADTAKLSTEGNAEAGGSAANLAADYGNDMAYFEREYGEVCNLMDGGKGDEAKMRLKSFMQKLMALSASSPEFTESNSKETEERLSALADNLTKMHAQYDELHKLATTIAG